MAGEKHSEDAYFIAYFYVRTKVFRRPYKKYGFDKLRDLSDFAYDNMSEIQEYYLDKYPELEIDGEGDTRKERWWSFIRQKGQEFYKHPDGPKLSNKSVMDPGKYGNLNERHSLVISKWSAETDESVLYDEFQRITGGEKSVSALVQAANRVPSTSRGRKPVEIDQETLQSGYVYIIKNSNPAFNGWKKIGKTSNLDNRMASYRTYEPNSDTKFEYLAAFESEHAYEIEQRTHSALNVKLMNDSFNQNRKGEWYFISLEKAIEEIKMHWFGSDFSKSGVIIED